MAGPRFADRKEARAARQGWRGGGFCVLPIEVLKDTRLTPRDLRVLIALHAFKDQAGRCWPSRGLLAGLTGLPERRITNVTTRLAALGWLSKEGNGGRSQACRYRLGVPETVTESVMVTDPVAVTKPVTKTVTDSVTKTVTETVRGIEQTMNIPENKPLSCAEPEVGEDRASEPVQGGSTRHPAPRPWPLRSSASGRRTPRSATRAMR